MGQQDGKQDLDRSPCGELRPRHSSHTHFAHKTRTERAITQRLRESETNLPINTGRNKDVTLTWLKLYMCKILQRQFISIEPSSKELEFKIPEWSRKTQAMEINIIFCVIITQNWPKQETKIAWREPPYI